MNKAEVVELLQEIEAAYKSFRVDNPKATVAAWHRVLKDYEVDIIQNNFDRHLKTSQYAPTVADLVKEPKIERERYIPTAEETGRLLTKMEQEAEAAKNDPHLQEAREKARQEINKILRRG